MPVCKRGPHWIVDYRDQAGIRHIKRFSTTAYGGDRAAKAAAEDEWARLLPGLRGPRRVISNPNIALTEYAHTWLGGLELAPATRESYTWALERYLLPQLGTRPVRTLDRSDVKALLLWLKQPREGSGKVLSRKSIKLIVGTLSTCMAEAVEDRVLSVNPAGRLRRLYKQLLPAKIAGRFRPFTEDELGRFLGVASEPWSTLLYLLSRTGLRIGEALALQTGDIDYVSSRLYIRRQWTRQEIRITKSGKERAVTVGAEVLVRLRAQIAAQTERHMAAGRELVYVFSTVDGDVEKNPRGLYSPGNIRRTVRRLCKAAAIAAIHSTHDLRHTYATLMLSKGAPLKWVQEQLGHGSPVITATVYAGWLPAESHGAENWLDSRDAQPAAEATVSSGSPAAASAGTPRGLR